MSDLSTCGLGREAIGGPWNVVVTVHEDEFRTVRKILGDFGMAVPTDYHNVLVMRVADPREFLEALARRIADEPGLLNSLSRVAVATETFTFKDPADFEAHALAILERFLPQLAGKAFHLRMHRRGLKGSLSTHEEEQRLGRALLEMLQRAGTPGRASFEDPDAIVSIETVNHAAGVSLWTREDRKRYRLLKLH